MSTTTTTTTPSEVTLAPIVEALHKVYSDHLAPAVKEATGQDLPPALFIVKRDARAWGHITVRPAWEASAEELDTDYAYGATAVSMGAPMTTTVTRGFHEIMVSGECLALGAREVFGTVAHEVAHAYNIASGIRDVDSNGRHNKKFKDAAESLFSLTITEHKTYGWTLTEVGDECATTWAEAIASIEEAITASAPRQNLGGFGGGFGGFGTFGGGSPAPKGRDKNLKKATCGCGKSIRVSASNLEYVGACRGCGEDFTF